METGMYRLEGSQTDGTRVRDGHGKVDSRCKHGEIRQVDSLKLIREGRFRNEGCLH